MTALSYEFQCKIKTFEIDAIHSNHNHWNFGNGQKRAIYIQSTPKQSFHEVLTHVPTF